MANETANDVQKFAMASLMISLCLNILFGFYAYAELHQSLMGNQIGVDSDNVWVEVISNTGINDTLTQNTPTNIATANGDPSGSKLAAKGSIDQGNFDVIQGMVNLGILLGTILTVIGMLMLGPMVTMSQLHPYVGNQMLWWLITVLGVIWQVIMFWLIVRFFLKKS